jgi:hypothetical protein
MEALLDITILSWNIRGAQNNNARRHLKELMRKHNPTLMAIYETHVPFSRLSSFWANNGSIPIHVPFGSSNTQQQTPYLLSLIPTTTL